MVVASPHDDPVIPFHNSYLLAWFTPNKAGTKAEVEVKKRARRRKDRMVEEYEYFYFSTTSLWGCCVMAEGRKRSGGGEWCERARTKKYCESLIVDSVVRQSAARRRARTARFVM